jgi:hypothetical protein
MRIVARPDSNIMSVNLPGQPEDGFITNRSLWCIQFVAWKFGRPQQYA